MKKIILLLSLLLSLSFAENNTTIEEELLFKTDANLSLEEVKNIKEFRAIDRGKIYYEKGKNYWLKVKLNSNMQSGTYLVRHGLIDFDRHSFTKVQNMYKLENIGVKKFSFTYDKNRDEVYYYISLKKPLRMEFIDSVDIDIVSMKSFLDKTTNYFYYLALSSLAIGLLLMTGVYNFFIYYYNREKAFLYYAFMQFSMVGLQSFFTKLIPITELFIRIHYCFASVTALFATLFIQSFFNTLKHTPILDRVLRFYIILLLIDIFLIIIFGYDSFAEKYEIYSIFGLLYLFVGYIRLKDGFKPAIFFLVGWGSLILALFIDERFVMNAPIDVFLMGAVIEAVLLALALAYKIKLIQTEKEEQKELMIHQSKLASMGEMIGNITHQWRQPLSHLSYTIMNIEDAFKHKNLDEVYLNKKVSEANGQIEFMSQTIDDFRDFYAVSKEKETFSFADEIKEVLSIMEHALSEQDIEVELIVTADIEVFNYKNEYKQVLLNLLSNAKDALVENVTLAPKIIITINQNEVSIADNAGGIEVEIIEKMFEPYFTTKKEHSGIGLYMSKMIVERNMDGKLTVFNRELGAEFKMNF